MSSDIVALGVPDSLIILEKVAYILIIVIVLLVLISILKKIITKPKSLRMIKNEEK